MGGWFYWVSRVYQPPNFIERQEDQRMRAEAVLRRIGERIARANVEMQLVSERFVAKWQAEWNEEVDRIVRGDVSIEDGADSLAGLASKLSLRSFIEGLVK